MIPHLQITSRTFKHREAFVSTFLRTCRHLSPPPFWKARVLGTETIQWSNPPQRREVPVAESASVFTTNGIPGLRPMGAGMGATPHQGPRPGEDGTFQAVAA